MAENCEFELPVCFVNGRQRIYEIPEVNPPRTSETREENLEKKEELEQAIDQLKFEKASMNADDYKKQLTRLLLELAKTQEEIEK